MVASTATRSSVFGVFGRWQIVGRQKCWGFLFELALVQWIDFGILSPDLLLASQSWLAARRSFVPSAPNPGILRPGLTKQNILSMVLRLSEASWLSKLHFQRFNALQAARSLLVWSMLEWMSYVTGRSREKDEKAQALCVFLCVGLFWSSKISCKVMEVSP